MEIVFNQQVYPSGTIEISYRYYTKDDVGMQWLESEFSLGKLRSTYKFKYSTKYFAMSPKQLTEVAVDSDLVQNPKQLDICDWQLLKIIHPEVKSFQWEVFQVMKDLVDNVTTEEYTLSRIKSILQKENKIES